MSRLSEWFREASVKAIIFYAFTNWILPIGVPIVTAWVAYIENLPLAYGIAATSLAFGGVSSGMLRFSEWRERQSPEGKLGFQQVFVYQDIKSRGWLINFVVENTAYFPIDFELSELQESIDDRIPKRTKLRQGQMAPFSSSVLTGYPIEIEPPKAVNQVPGELKGKLSFCILYGRKGAKKTCKMQRKFKFTLFFDEKGNLIRQSVSDIEYDKGEEKWQPENT